MQPTRDAADIPQRQRIEDAERLAALRMRAQRSLTDPRPSLSEADVSARLDDLLGEQQDADMEVDGPDSDRSPTSLKAMVAAQVARLDKMDQDEAMAWIEAVSEFDTEAPG